MNKIIFYTALVCLTFVIIACFIVVQVSQKTCNQFKKVSSSESLNSAIRSDLLRHINAEKIAKLNKSKYLTRYSFDEFDEPFDNLSALGLRKDKYPKLKLFIAIDPDDTSNILELGFSLGRDSIRFKNNLMPNGLRSWSDDSYVVCR